MVPRTCERCGAAFEAKESRVRKGQARYCSISCGRRAVLALTPTVRVKCERCGEEFATQRARQKQGRGRFCSQSCARQAMWDAREREPARYATVRRRDHPLASPSGTVTAHRVALYERIGGGIHTCHWCGTTVEWGDTLYVDHLDNDGRNNAPENLVPSCHRCNCTRGRTDLVGDDELFVVRGGHRVRAVERTCETCGKTVLIPAADKRPNRGRFCSRPCMYQRAR